MKKRVYPLFQRGFGIMFVLVVLATGAVSAESYLLCLGSFAVPEHGSRYKTTLIETGIPSVTYSTRVGDEMMMRVVYAVVYRESAAAAIELKRMRANPVIRSAGIDDIWVLRVPDREAAAILSLLPTVLPSSLAMPSTRPVTTPPTMAIEPAASIPESPQMPETAEPKEPQANATEWTASRPPAKDPESDTEITRDPSPEPDPPPAAPVTFESVPYKVVHDEGYANCIFATEPIALGKETDYTLKTVFTRPEPVYARCYFPEPVGEVAPGDFWHEIWIDGKMRMRTSFTTAIDPTWDQIQVWITEDEYKNQMDELGSGEHTVILWVMKNEFHGERAVAGTNAAGEIEAKMEEIWIPVRLSKGTFTYIVP